MKLFAAHDSRLFPGLLLVGIVALFAAQLRALIRYRIDYPIMDDWRYYFAKAPMPHELSLAWLMRPAEDTVHVSGKLIDWLYFHFVAHDYSSLAAASFGFCVGTWLVCGVALCWLAARDRPLLRAASLSTFALPLAAAPYWVAASPKQWLEPVIAYHQAFPVVGLFALGLFAASERRRLPPFAGPAFAWVATLFFALAYSSGAVALVVFGGTLLGTAWLASGRGERRDPLVGIGGAILAAALLSLVAHVWAPWEAFGANPVLEMRSHSMTLPWDRRFWHFFFGLFDRAVLSTRVDGVSLLRGGAVAIAVILPVIPLAVGIVGGRFAGRERTSAIAILAIIVAVVSYAALVAYGRGSFGTQYFPREHPLGHLSGLYAHARFFYWWVAASLPLVVVAWGLVGERLHSRRAAGWAAAVLAGLCLLPKSQHAEYPAGYFGHWDYSARYSRDAAETVDLIKADLARENGVDYISLRHREWARLPKRVRNNQYRPFFRPGGPIYARADAAGAEFVRHWGLPTAAPVANPGDAGGRD